MRGFQTYTKERRRVRRWWLWLLPVVLIFLAVGVVLAAGPLSLRTLGHQTGPEAGGDGASPGSWIERVFGGGGPLAEGPLNVLVLGVDTRPDDPEMGSRTDTIMLVQVVPKTGDVKLLSVPRDLYVEVDPGEKDRINAAYNYGGIEQTVDQPDQIGLHAGDRARRERTHDQAADAGMGGGIVEDEARGVVLVEQGGAVFRRKLLLLVR